MKIAIVVGHTTGADKGAYSAYLKQSEQPFNNAVAQALKCLAPQSYDVYTHSLQSYYEREKLLADKINKQAYDLVLELHFNAASPAANGTEVCYFFNSAKGKKAAQYIAAGLSLAYDTTLRGDKGARALVNKNDRGYWFIYLPKAPAIIIEPFFGSNPEALKFADVGRYASELHHILQGLKL
jgi:N-acetylmuramoyl-L-alanine amidase